MDLRIKYEFDPEVGDGRVDVSRGLVHDLEVDAEFLSHVEIMAQFGARSVTFVLDDEFVEKYGRDYADGLEIVELGRIA